jgi:hypothetical protein
VAWKRSAEVPEPTTATPTATVAAAAAAAPMRAKRGAGARRACPRASMRARRAAGASTPSTALRASETARCCSASWSASSGDAATRASSAARRSGASDPSASAASSAPASFSRRRLIIVATRKVAPNVLRRRDPRSGPLALGEHGAAAARHGFATPVAPRASEREPPVEQRVDLHAQEDPARAPVFPRELSRSELPGRESPLWRHTNRPGIDTGRRCL